MATELPGDEVQFLQGIGVMWPPAISASDVQNARCRTRILSTDTTGVIFT